MYYLRFLALVLTGVAAVPTVVEDEPAGFPPELSIDEPSFPIFGPPSQLQPGDIALGDMLFTNESYAAFTASVRDVIQSYQLWTVKDKEDNIIVPYTISPAINAKQKEMIAAGIADMRNTCLRFVDNSIAKQKDYVSVVSEASGCNSYVGNIHSGPQTLNLGQNCFTREIVAHEFGHAVGLAHEHQRSDRDQYLKLNMQNVHQHMRDNFDLPTGGFVSMGTPFNYLSNMMYSFNAMAVDPSQGTMIPTDPTKKSLMLHHNKVSFYDDLLVVKAYKCSETWAKKCGSMAKCENFGYSGPKCTCICPPGTKGSRCEQKIAASLPEYPPLSCGGIITNATKGISVPSFKANKPRNDTESCTWWIKKPETASSVEISVTAAKIFKRHTDNTCYFESLEVRTNNLHFGGQQMCGDEVKPGLVISVESDIVLDFTSNTIHPQIITGFTFDVSFK